MVETLLVRPRNVAWQDEFAQRSVGTMDTGLKTAWGETVRERMRAKAAKGVTTGPVPLGYRKVRRDGIVSVEVDEETAPLVREAFRLAGLKRTSLRRIAATVGARGLASQRGTPLSATALWRILTNLFYLGAIRYSGEEMDGTHQPLVTRAEFDIVQERLANRRRN